MTSYEAPKLAYTNAIRTTRDRDFFLPTDYEARLPPNHDDDDTEVRHSINWQPVVYHCAAEVAGQPETRTNFRGQGGGASPF